MLLSKIVSLWIPAVVPPFSRAGAGIIFSLAHGLVEADATTRKSSPAISPGTTDYRVRDSSQTFREPVMVVVTWIILGVKAGLIADMQDSGQRPHGIAGPAIGRSGHRTARR
jgi:hypothetical protein